jgi:tRNA-splicing ligase RtcB
MRTIETEKIPIKMWLDYLEDGAEQQAKNLANLPFAFHHIAIMPDAHQGFGMPIGGVLATEDYIIPNAVGGDIGCGANAVQTSIKVADMPYSKVKEIFQELKRRVPVGFGTFGRLDSVRKGTYESLMASIEPEWIFDGVSMNEKDRAMQQLGTLGGGNHFIEMQSGSDGYVWLMLHSGSRYLGQVINRYYDEYARKNNTFGVPDDIAPLPISGKVSDDAIGHRYLYEMNYALNYAYTNRMIMMGEFQEAVRKFTKGTTFGEMINIAHNFASLEQHYGHSVFVHRKGATQAFTGQTGIIPGSQGTFSYIVEGLGNPDSFMSCSHGAGRVLSRSKAKQMLNLKQQQELMAGIVHDIDSIKALDEAPGAYKNIEQVMENQKDLVKIIVKLKPLGVLKG